MEDCSDEAEGLAVPQVSSPSATVWDGKQLRDYEIDSRLGKGAYGVVYRAKRKGHSSYCVIKTIPLGELEESERGEALNEVRLLASVDSPYVVKYYDSFVENDELHIVMEYCNRGDLQRIIRKLSKDSCRNVAEDRIWSILVQVALGLHFLHSRGILHRDMKAANVFIHKDESSGMQSVKIGDLGVAKLLDSTTCFATTLVGTPYYLSPELCQNKRYNEKSDIWSLGVLLYQCCTLRLPFEANNPYTLMTKIIRGTYEPINSRYLSPQLVDLTRQLLTPDSDARPSIKHLLSIAHVQERALALGFALPPDIVPQTTIPSPIKRLPQLVIAESTDDATPRTARNEPPSARWSSQGDLRSARGSSPAMVRISSPSSSCDSAAALGSGGGERTPRGTAVVGGEVGSPGGWRGPRPVTPRMLAPMGGVSADARLVAGGKPVTGRASAPEHARHITWDGPRQGEEDGGEPLSSARPGPANVNGEQRVQRQTIGPINLSKSTVRLQSSENLTSARGSINSRSSKRPSVKDLKHASRRDVKEGALASQDDGKEVGRETPPPTLSPDAAAVVAAMGGKGLVVDASMNSTSSGSSCAGSTLSRSFVQLSPAATLRPDPPSTKAESETASVRHGDTEGAVTDGLAVAGGSGRGSVTTLPSTAVDTTETVEHKAADAKEQLRRTRLQCLEMLTEDGFADICRFFRANVTTSDVALNENQLENLEQLIQSSCRIPAQKSYVVMFSIQRYLAQEDRLQDLMSWLAEHSTSMRARAGRIDTTAAGGHG